MGDRMSVDVRGEYNEIGQLMIGKLYHFLEYQHFLLR